MKAKVFYSLSDGSTFEFIHSTLADIFPLGSLLYNVEIVGITIYTL